MITESFIRNGKVYFVTLDGDIFVVYKDGKDFTVEFVTNLPRP